MFPNLNHRVYFIVIAFSGSTQTYTVETHQKGVKMHHAKIIVMKSIHGALVQ